MMDEKEIVRLVESLIKPLMNQIEIAEVVTVDGATASVKRQGQTAETRKFPVVSGLTVLATNRVVLLRPGGDLNSAIIIAKF